MSRQTKGRRNKMMQSSGLRSTNTTGFKGVKWKANERKYEAYVTLDGKYHSLGRFEDALDAGCAASDFRLAHGVTPYDILNDEDT